MSGNGERIGGDEFPADMRGKVRFGADFDETLRGVEHAGLENVQPIPIGQFAGRAATLEVATKVAGVDGIEWFQIAPDNTLWPQ